MATARNWLRVGVEGYALDVASILAITSITRALGETIIMLIWRSERVGTVRFVQTPLRQMFGTVLSVYLQTLTLFQHIEVALVSTDWGYIIKSSNNFEEEIRLRNQVEK